MCIDSVIGGGGEGGVIILGAEYFSPPPTPPTHTHTHICTFCMLPLPLGVDHVIVCVLPVMTYTKQRCLPGFSTRV